VEQAELQLRVQRFIRAFGLLEQDQTPCGFPLRPSQAHALHLLAQGEAVPQHLLAGELHLDKSTVSRLVDGLVNRGWVERAANPDDRREVRLMLTAAGRTVVAQLTAATAAKYRGIWERIPPEKRPQVVEALAVLNDALNGATKENREEHHGGRASRRARG
jgi:DNA-binding MarR family transcriptional regulator